MADLKPCPFCGSAARVWGSEKPLDPAWKLCVCDCPRCGAKGSYHGSHAEAIAAWNRRAEPATHTGEVEDLNRALARLTTIIEDCRDNGRLRGLAMEVYEVVDAALRTRTPQDDGG